MDIIKLNKICKDLKLNQKDLNTMTSKILKQTTALPELPKVFKQMAILEIILNGDNSKPDGVTIPPWEYIIKNNNIIVKKMDDIILSIPSHISFKKVLEQKPFIRISKINNGIILEIPIEGEI